MTEQEKQQLINDFTLYIENTRMIYDNVIMPVCNNLARKKFKGSYDDEKAKKAWYNVVNYGLQRYFKEVYQEYYANEYGYISAWHYLLTTHERKQIADELQAFYASEVDFLTNRLIKENEKPSFVGDFMNMRNCEPVADCDSDLWDTIMADDDAVFDDEGYEILK